MKFIYKEQQFQTGAAGAGAAAFFLPVAEAMTISISLINAIRMIRPTKTVPMPTSATDKPY